MLVDFKFELFYYISPFKVTELSDTIVNFPFLNKLKT